MKDAASTTYPIAHDVGCATPNVHDEEGCMRLYSLAIFAPNIEYAHKGLELTSLPTSKNVGCSRLGLSEEMNMQKMSIVVHDVFLAILVSDLA